MFGVEARRDRSIAVWSVALLTVGIVAACSPMGPGASRWVGGRQFTSNGERIYFTATSASGRPISYQEGPGGGMMGRPACVDCHGEGGTGGRVTLMMQTFEAPNITWPNLTGVHGSGGHEQGGQRDHEPYTEQTVRRAITAGLDPAGNRLDRLMPRWSLGDEDLADLVSYLKTLK